MKEKMSRSKIKVYSCITSFVVSVCSRRDL